MQKSKAALFSAPHPFHGSHFCPRIPRTQIPQQDRIQFRKAVVERKLGSSLRQAYRFLNGIARRIQQTSGDLLSLNYGTPLSGPLEIGAARLHRFRVGRLGQQTYLRRSQATGKRRARMGTDTAILDWFLSAKEQVAQSASQRTARSRTARGASEGTQDLRWALCSPLAPRTSNTSLPCEQNLKLVLDSRAT